MHHQATECRAPCNTVGIQTPDTTAAISTTSLCPPAPMPMLMPVFFQQWGTSILPTILPTVHFELPVRITTSDVQPPPASALDRSFPAGVNQGTQASESHIQLNAREIAVQVQEQVPKLPVKLSRAACGQLGVWEEESGSDWEELKGGSSPSTPSTPFSSPNHKTILKKAMELYPVNSSIRETPFAKKDLQPSISEACQTLVSELAPPIQLVTETILEDTTVDETPQTMTANETRYVRTHVCYISRAIVIDTPGIVSRNWKSRCNHFR